MITTLAFFIFGWKVKEKEQGPCYPIFCANCRNEVHYHLLKWRKYTHVFWIPLIPHRANYDLVCPVCGAGYELEKDEFEAAQDLAEQTRLFRDHELSNTEYAHAVAEFEEAVHFVDDPLDPSGYDAYQEDVVDEVEARGFQ